MRLYEIMDDLQDGKIFTYNGYEIWWNEFDGFICKEEGNSHSEPIVQLWEYYKDWKQKEKEEPEKNEEMGEKEEMEGDHLSIWDAIEGLQNGKRYRYDKYTMYKDSSGKFMVNVDSSEMPLRGLWLYVQEWKEVQEEKKQASEKSFHRANEEETLRFKVYRYIRDGVFDMVKIRDGDWAPATFFHYDGNLENYNVGILTDEGIRNIQPLTALL